MILRKWDRLPINMRVEAVRPYYDILANKKSGLLIKRLFDCFLSLILFILFLPLLILIACAVFFDSKGKILFTQARVTAYGRQFEIYKFRTMVNNADQLGPSITAESDPRITRVGRFLRNYRLDEIPQLINVLKGEMTFVSTRPETPKFVDQYSDEMRATLLLPAGITSSASVLFKDESAMLSGETDIEGAYMEKILPIKMKYNLKALKEFGFLADIGVMIKTILSFCGVQISGDAKYFDEAHDSKTGGIDVH